MKKSLVVLAVVVLSALASAVPASAQFRFGVQAGVNVNSFHFNSSTFDSSNRMGWNLGVMGEFTVPVKGIGLDLALRYVRRNSRFETENGSFSDDRDYLEIPLNVKWKINIPAVNKIIRPYVATGPSVAVLISRQVLDDFHNKKYDTAWNFGFGAELFSKVQVGASYGLGLTKALKAVGATETANIDGKNRYWTITATYLF